jgi:hypothetical protein
MKHKDKLKLARKMTPKLHTGLFLTPEWEARKRGIASRKVKSLSVKKKGEVIK